MNHMTFGDLYYGAPWNDLQNTVFNDAVELGDTQCYLVHAACTDATLDLKFQGTTREALERAISLGDENEIVASLSLSAISDTEVQSGIQWVADDHFPGIGPLLDVLTEVLEG